MAAPITSLLRTLRQSKDLVNSLFSAEKTQIPRIKSQANELFQSSYQQYIYFRSNVNSIENKTLEHSELTLTIAETAFATENYEIARDVIEEYLLQSPQQDSFYCRAKILLGLLIDHDANSTYGEVNIRQRKLALKELQSALVVASGNENKERYQFILFNISIECWKIIRQFLRKGRAKYFKDEMVQFCQSLESLREIDRNWLISFLSGTAYCLEDGDEPKRSLEFLDKALIIAEELVTEITQKEAKKFEQLTTLSKQIDEIQKLSHAHQENEDKRGAATDGGGGGGGGGGEAEELFQRLQSLQKELGTAKEDYKSLAENKIPLQDRVMRLYFQKIYAFPTDGKKLLTLPQIAQSIRMKSLTTLHLMSAGCILPNEYEASLKTMMTELDNAVSGNIPPSQNPSAYYANLAETYFDLCRTARNLGGRKDGGFLREISITAASKGKDLVRVQNILTPLLLVKQDLCSAILAADNCQNYSQLLNNSESSEGMLSASFGADLPPPLLTNDQIEGYTLNSRLETIKLLERILSVSQNRIKEEFLIQEICLEIWNVMYPLIQSSLRKQIHRSLQLLSSALLEIDSPLYRLRCQVAYELSKCEENVDFVVKAYQEGLNALDLDYGDLNNVSQDFLKSFGGAGGALAAGGAPPGKSTSPRGNKSSAASQPQPAAAAPPPPAFQPVISRHDSPGYDSDRKFDVLISPYVDILHLRASVYDTPDSPEDQIILNLQQIRESSSKRYKKDLLSKSSQTMFEILQTRERDNLCYFELNELEREHYAILQQEMLLKQELELKNKTGGTHITTVKSSSVGNMTIPLQMIETVLAKIIRNRPVEEVKLDAKGNPIPTPSPAVADEKIFTPLTKVIQQRVHIMTTIANFGHVSQHEIYKQVGQQPHHGYVSRKDTEYRIELSYIVEKSLLYLLTHTWKPKEFMFRKLLVGQIDGLCKLAESLINRLDAYHITDEDLMIIIPHNGPLPVRPAISFQDLKNPPEDAVLPNGTIFIDPRSMGILGRLPSPHKSSHGSESEVSSNEEVMNTATTTMLSIKQTVLRLLTQALVLAMDSVDIVSIQNVLIYFWNIHIHIFKYNLYHLVLKEFYEFLDLALKALDLAIQSLHSLQSSCGKSGLDKINYPTIDYKLQANILEVCILCEVSKGNIPLALDIGMKGCNSYKAASTYSRTRLCELVSRLSIISGAAPTNATTTQPAKGGGGKKGSSAPTPSSDLPLPTFDNPFLTVISQLVALEVTTSSAFLSTLEDPVGRYQSIHPALIEKAILLMKGEVATAVNDLNNRTNEIGERIPLSQEENDEIQELLVSCWARLTRANLKQRNIYSTNDTANECMLILNKGISQLSSGGGAGGAGGAGNESDFHDFQGERKMRIHRRVWRWASLCSRYMGLAISYLIHDEGQERELQNELRLASLRHFTVSSQFGVNADYNDLILFPAVDAWNVFLPLIGEICQTGQSLQKKKLSNSLINLQRSILKSLLFYKSNPRQNQESEEETPTEDDPEELIHVVKLNYYLAIIEELAQQLDWKTALEVVMESFENIPTRYQKPLWKWRVIVMSKRGKNVLDGLQKLKETDVILQARVFAILARNSSKPSQQMEAYQKTIEILNGDLNRVEYLLEIAQWISSSGLPTTVAYEMIQGALDSLYEIEENCLQDEIEPLHDGTVSESSRSQKTNKQSRTQSSRGSISRRGSAMLLRSRQGSKQSLRSEKLTSLMDAPRLNLKQLDQAIRGVSMLSLLESVTELRGNRALEVIFFIERSLLCWQGALEQFLLPEELPPSCKLPTDPIDLLIWIPPLDFINLVKKCQDLAPLLVPSSQSLPSLQLTFHYLLICYEILEQNGYVKSAALCLAWLRLCVIFASNQSQVEILLIILYYKSLILLSKSQLLKRQASNEEPGVMLPDLLGITSTTVSDVVRKIGFFDPALNHVPPEQQQSQMTRQSSFEENEDPVVTNKAHSSSSRNHSTQRSSRDSKRLTATPMSSSPLSAVLTFTKEYSLNIDTLSYSLTLCDLLIELGQVYRAKKIASFVFYSCHLAPNHRLKIIASRVLSQLNYLSGNYNEAIYLIETCTAEMSETSDMKELAKQIQILMSCYLATNNFSSATTLMNNTIQLFSTVAEKQQNHSSTSRRSVGYSSTKTFPTESSIPPSQKGNPLPMNDLLSYATLEAFVEVASQFMNKCIVSNLISALKLQAKTIQNASLTSLATSRSSARGSGGGRGVREEDSLNAPSASNSSRYDLQFIDFTSLTDLFQKVSSLLSTTNNRRSVLYSSLLSSYSQCVLRVVRIYYNDYTRNVSRDATEIFDSWIDSNLKQITEFCEESVSIANGLQNRVPLAEIIYNFKPTSSPEKRLILTNSLNYEFIQRQQGLWEVLLYHHLYHLQNTQSSLQIINTNEMNPIEKYLDEHRPSTAAKSQLQNLNSLSPSLIDKCVTIGSALSQLATNTPYEGLERFVLYYAAKLGQKIESGEHLSTLSIQWMRKLPTEELNQTDPNSYLVRRQEDLQIIQLLEGYVLQLLFSESKNSLFSFLSLSNGSYFLMEAAGRHSPAVTSFYLMTYQNIMTRQWLYQIWKDCLNPTSEISQSLQRVEALNESQSPVSGRAQEKLQLEYEFLKTTSPVWNRLNILSNPKEIFASSFFTPQTCVVSIQFCPLKRTLYATAGYPKVNKSTSMPTDLTSSEELPGCWFVNKIFFDEEKRRALHTLSSKYQRWIDGTSKFISSYGEGLVESMDFDGYDSFNDSINFSESMRNIMKAEHAIEEEFKSLLEIFSNLLQPLFGIGSELDHFIEAIQLQMNSSPTPAPPVIGKSASTVSSAASAASATLTPPSHNVILLIGDEILQHLPFEALPLIQSRFNGQLSRDFSLNVLGNRLKSFTSSDAVDKIQLQSPQVMCFVDPFDDDPSKEIPGSPRKSEIVDKPVIETPVEPEKKNAKNSKTSTAAATATAAAAAAASAANVIPSQQSAPYTATRSSMVQVVSKFQQTLTGGGRWTNVMTTEKRGRGVALQDWISLVSRDTSPAYEKTLFVYTPGRFLGTLMNPKEFCHLNFRGIGLLFLADWTQTDLSFRRQLTIESKKSIEELSLETPLICNALCSLTGVGCSVSSLWSTTPSALEKHTACFWKEFTKGNISVSQAVNRGRWLDIDTATHRMMHEVGLTGTAGDQFSSGPDSAMSTTTLTGAGAGAGAKNLLRSWVRYSRVVYGIPSVFYQAT